MNERKELAMKRFFLLATILLSGAALAQQSASFRLTEHTFNAGGHPSNGTVPSSAGYRITLDAIGTAVGTASLSQAVPFR